MGRFTQLTTKERYLLEHLLQEGLPKSEIACKLGRHRSTMYREINRNSGSDGVYRSDDADLKAKTRCARGSLKIFSVKSVCDEVKFRLGLGCSPEQISRRHLSDLGFSVSHELIYQYINRDRKNGGLLYLNLPRRGRAYKKRNVKVAYKRPKGGTPKRSIETRPARATAALESGHWEGDTIVGKGHRTGLLTLVDRRTMFTLIRRLVDLKSDTVMSAVLNCFAVSPGLARTLTFDNGVEFALHGKMEELLRTRVYFANPYSPWERGLNENTNGLIRWFFPKGTDFSEVSDEEVARVQKILNDRPRRKLGFKTPKEMLLSDISFRLCAFQLAI